MDLPSRYRTPPPRRPLFQVEHNFLILLIENKILTEKVENF